MNVIYILDKLPPVAEVERDGIRYVAYVGSKCVDCEATPCLPCEKGEKGLAGGAVLPMSVHWRKKPSVNYEDGELLQAGFLSRQVCVPTGWGDEEVIKFAEQAYPSGTTGGGQIRKEKDERVTCIVNSSKVPIVLLA